MKNIAVILAGGSGTRLGEPLPKQFIKLAGKKVIEHTIGVFQSHPLIDEICVVVHGDYIREMDTIRLTGAFDKLRKVLRGGRERYESSLAAIRAYEDEGECNLIFHDSVRPMVSTAIIDDCIQALGQYEAVDVAVPTTDTIIEVNSRDEIVSVPPRARLRNGQTPQAFRLSVIRQAYENALQDPDFITTDDCGVVLRYLPEVPVHVVKGAQFNMKLTYKEDIFLLDKLFQLRSVSGVSDSLTDKDIMQLKGKTIVVFGGTQGIGGEIVGLCSSYGVTIFPFSRSTGTDVTNPGEIADALASVYARTGRIDAVVNTAGLLAVHPLTQMSQDEIRRSVDVNYLGCVNVALQSFDYLKKSGGMLLFYTSSSYTRGRAMYSVYSSMKAAVVNFVQALAEEWADDGIRINCINPERTRTPMRVKNFGIEPENTLLDPRIVALVSLKTLVSGMTGEVVDVKRH